MRDTDYAKELARAEIGGNRIERLFVKGPGEEEIRFSWWKDGRMQTKPLDLPEHELLPLLREAIQQGVFSEIFLRELQSSLEGRSGRLPDDFAKDILLDMANLDEQDTHVPGTIFVSTALGSHGPRLTWYPGSPGRALPCLIVSIGSEPQLREDFLPARISRPVLPLVTAWVRLNHVDLLEFWNHGETWDRRRVSAFLDGLRPLPR